MFMKMIDVLIVEDQSMVRGALSALLELQGEFKIVDQVGNGQDAMQFLLKHTVDIVLTDIEMPGMTGLELAAQIRKRIESPPKVVVLTTFSRSGYIERARKLDIDGYLLKEAPSDDLARGLKKVMRGHKVFDPALVNEAPIQVDPLTDRERQILRYVEDGKKTMEIAKLVFRSEGTVRNTLSETMRKLGVRNRVEAIRLARGNGWL